MVQVERQGSSGRKFICPDCGRTNFPSASAVQMHRTAKHKTNGKALQKGDRSLLSADHLPSKPKKRWYSWLLFWRRRRK
jgi:uncharacterized Zn ribbon protein